MIRLASEEGVLSVMAFPYLGIHNLAHDRELAAALGDMLVAWANIEKQMLIVLACILNVHPNQMLVGYFRIPTFEARTKLIRAFLSEWETKDFDRDAIAHIISKISKLS